MAVQKKTSSQPTMVIDLIGIREALKSKSNSTKVTIIDKIESGEMWILHGVSKQLKDIYPEIYDDFKKIKNKKYLPVSVSAQAQAQSLIESFQGQLFGVPLSENFEAIAAARLAKLTLVSAGKGYSHCYNIVKKCNLSPNAVKSIQNI